MTLRAFIVVIGSVLAVATVGCGGCADQSPPLRAVPGAKAVLTMADAGAAALIADALTSAGVLDSKDALTALLTTRRADLAGRPAVVSFLDTGAVVIATRVPRGTAMATNGEPVIGSVRTAPDVAADALVRFDGDRALIGLPRGTDRTAMAGLLEAVAATPQDATVQPAPPSLVPDGTVHLTLHAGAALLGGPTELRVRAAERAIEIDEVEPIPARPALTARAPRWACALDDAALVLSIPPIAAGDGLPSDAFAGRLVLAVYPSTAATVDPKDPLAQVALVATGVPRDAQAADELFASAQSVAGKGATTTRAGNKRRLTVDGARKLVLRVDDDAFVLALGTGAPDIDTLTSRDCGNRQPPLFTASGERLAPLVLPTLVTPEVILKTMGGMAVEDALPLARLRGVRQVTLDATPAIRARIELKGVTQ